MVSCRLVEAAAAAAATLTGLPLSNWWIILLLIWPPKAGNARLFLTVYKLSLCYYTLWREKKYIYSCSSLKNLYCLNALYTSCHSRANLWSFFPETLRTRHSFKCSESGPPAETVDSESDRGWKKKRKKWTLSLSQFIRKCQCVIDCASLAPRCRSPSDQYHHYPNYAVG